MNPKALALILILIFTVLILVGSCGISGGISSTPGSPPELDDHYEIIEDEERIKTLFIGPIYYKDDYLRLKLCKRAKLTGVNTLFLNYGNLTSAGDIETYNAEDIYRDDFTVEMGENVRLIAWWSYSKSQDLTIGWSLLDVCELSKEKGFDGILVDIEPYEGFHNLKTEPNWSRFLNGLEQAHEYLNTNNMQLYVHCCTPQRGDVSGWGFNEYSAILYLDEDGSSVRSDYITLNCYDTGTQSENLYENYIEEVVDDSDVLTPQNPNIINKSIIILSSRNSGSVFHDPQCETVSAGKNGINAAHHWDSLKGAGVYECNYCEDNTILSVETIDQNEWESIGQIFNLGFTLPIPDPPTNLTAAARFNSQINLSWLCDSNDVQGFKLERKVGADGTFTQIATIEPGITTFNDGLSQSGTYYYRVSAFNSTWDSDYSNEAHASILESGEFTNFDISDGLAFYYVSSIAEDAEGGKWICTDTSGLIYFNDNGTPFASSDDTFMNFTSFDGLADNTCYAIAIDSLGGKWIGTGNGVKCLDDNNTPYEKSDDTWISFTTTDGLINNAVSSIEIDDNGKLWFGTGGGLSYLDHNGTPSNKLDDMWFSFTAADGLSGNTVGSIAIDSDGGKWLETGGPMNSQVGIDYFNENGTLSDKSDDTWVSYNSDDGLGYNIVKEIAIDSDGGKWFATNGGGLSYLDDNDTPSIKSDDAWATFSFSDGLHPNVLSVTIDEDSRKWIGSYRGLSYFDDNRTPLDKSDDNCTIYTHQDGLSDRNNYVNTIYIDSNGGKWLGTRLGGVSYLDDKDTPSIKSDDSWATFIEANGLINNHISVISLDVDDGKWIGTTRGLTYLDDNSTPSDKSDDSWISFFPFDGLPRNEVWAIALGPEGGKWLGCDGGIAFLDINGTVFDKSDDSWTTFSTIDGLVNGYVNSILIDDLDGKWIGTRGGLSYLNDNDTPFNKSDDLWVSYTTTDGLVDNFINIVIIDTSGNKWIGTFGGISCFNDNGTPLDKLDDTWTTYTVSDGLVHNIVETITIDNSGGKWIGTNGDGISYLDDNGTPHEKSDDSWIAFTNSDGLVNEFVYAIAIDSNEGKWIGTAYGINYLNDNNTPLNKLDDNWILFNTSDGLISNVGWDIGIDVSDGKWIATSSGISYLQ